MTFSHLHPLSDHFSHHHPIPPSQSSSLLHPLSLWLLLYPLSFPTLSLSYDTIIFCQHYASRSQYHTISSTPSLSSSFSIIISHHHFCPSSSVSPPLTNKLSNIWPLFSVIFSYSNPLYPSLVSLSPLWFSPSVTVILFLYCLLSPSFFPLFILYNLKNFCTTFCSLHHPLPSSSSVKITTMTAIVCTLIFPEEL